MDAGARTDEASTCWQCGAPADADCTCIRRLSISRRRHADDQGFPVSHGWHSDTVQIPVPRCARCQARNWVTGIAIGFAFLGGAITGGTEFPSRGWTTIVGGFATALPLWLGLRVYERAAGLRSLDEFPPVRRLRKDGWSDPV